VLQNKAFVNFHFGSTLLTIIPVESTIIVLEFGVISLRQQVQPFRQELIRLNSAPPSLPTHCRYLDSREDIENFTVHFWRRKYSRKNGGKCRRILRGRKPPVFLL